MKKILSICLVLLTSFALCACSSEEGKETNNQTKTEEKIYGVGETITYKKRWSRTCSFHCKFSKQYK